MGPTQSPPQTEVVTKDIFLTAFLLTCHAELKDVVLTDDVRGGRTFFVLSGPNVSEFEKRYANGTAMANVKQLKETLKNVKDIMFDRIRSAEIAGTNKSKEQTDEVHRRVYQTA